MFNVAVLKMKDIVKYFIGIMVTLFLVTFISRFITGEKKEKVSSPNAIESKIESKIQEVAKTSFISCFDHVIPAMTVVGEEYRQMAEEEKQEKSSILEELLATEIPVMKGIKKEEQQLAKSNTQNENEKATENTNQPTDETTAKADTGLPTQVVTNQPIAETFNVQYQNVKIKNQTKYTLTQEMLTPDITIDNKNILLFHTHSCESYTSSDAYPYTPTGTYRTTDLNYSVTRVGTELENQLKQYGLSVTHDTNYHDYPAYNGSYTRSLVTVQERLKTFPSDIIMDVHRDAIGSRPDYAPTVKIGENDYAAQIMFVIGTNGGGLNHPNWNQNLKFAIKVQQKAEEMYPGLFKPIMLTESRYNQHTGKYASIIEVGATGNTLDQCLTSMKYLAKVMDEVLK